MSPKRETVLLSTSDRCASLFGLQQSLLLVLGFFWLMTKGVVQSGNLDETARGNPIYFSHLQQVLLSFPPQHRRATASNVVVGWSEASCYINIDNTIYVTQSHLYFRCCPPAPAARHSRIEHFRNHKIYGNFAKQI